MWKVIQRQSKSILKDSLAVISLSWSLDLKRCGSEHILISQMHLGTELQDERD